MGWKDDAPSWLDDEFWAEADEEDIEDFIGFDPLIADEGAT